MFVYYTNQMKSLLYKPYQIIGYFYSNWALILIQRHRERREFSWSSITQFLQRVDEQQQNLNKLISEWAQA